MTITHPARSGHALWVMAHPRPHSLNGTLMEEGIRTLSGRYDVAASDLYAQGFDPVLGRGDLGSAADTPGTIGEQLGDAYRNGESPEDVRREQEKLADAELLVLQFPLWWYGPPAILKGWLDRVLTDGFAYGDLDPELGIPRRYGDGGLVGRRALIIVTAGDDARSLGPRGVSGDLDSLLFPLTHGALWYVGIDVLDLHVVHDADGLDADGAGREVARLAARLDGIAQERPTPLRRLRDGDYAPHRALREDILAGRRDLGIHRREE